jgi:hypothetical protein
VHLVERLQKIDCYEAMIEGTTPPKISKIIRIETNA